MAMEGVGWGQVAIEVIGTDGVVGSGASSSEAGLGWGVVEWGGEGRAGRQVI